MNSLELNHCLTSFCCYMKKREKEREREGETKKDRERMRKEREGGTTRGKEKKE